MHRASVALLLTLLAALAEPAAAVSVPFTGSFTIGGSGASPFLLAGFQDAGAGTAEVQYQGAALDSVLIPAGTFAISESFSSGPEQWSAGVQSQAGGFSGLASTPAANLPLTGHYDDTFFPSCDTFDPMCLDTFGSFYVPADKIGVPGPGFESTSILRDQSFNTVATYQWDSAPWTVTATGNLLEAQSLGSITCTAGWGPCPGATFGASFSITLQLDPGQTGFGAGSGGASLLGGSGTTGGLDVALDVSSGSGLLTASFQQATLADIASGFGVALPFALPSSLTSLWEITGGEDFEGTAQLTFAYDPALLPVGFDETQLAIAHLERGTWELLTGSVDADANTITVETDSFSPFSLVSVPEPATSWLVLAALLPAARWRARCS